MRKRAVSGPIAHNATRFPSGIAALADYVHGKGKVPAPRIGVQLRSGSAPFSVLCSAKASGWGLLSTMHTAGLKLGIYTDSGSKTCAKYSGSLGFEEEDAAQIAAWGVDFLKVHTLVAVFVCSYLKLFVLINTMLTSSWVGVQHDNCFAPTEKEVSCPSTFLRIPCSWPHQLMFELLPRRRA